MKVPQSASNFTKVSVPILETDLGILARAAFGQVCDLTKAPLGLPGPYEVFVNGKQDFLGQDGLEGLRARAAHGEFVIFADDIHSELLLHGKSGGKASSVVRKGESLTWKVLLVLLERVGGFWSHKDLFERVEGKPYARPKDARKAYQWVRHLKESLEEAQKTGELSPKLDVDQLFDTQRASGRVYVSEKVTACVVRCATS